jgi:hypothetical protein
MTKSRGFMHGLFGLFNCVVGFWDSQGKLSNYIGLENKYLQCCKSFEENGILRAHMGVMKRFYCFIQFIFTFMSNF